MSEKIFVISGPTASGKSGLALELANFEDIVIINADSLQIYQGLPILSSQPTQCEQKQVEHKLYSIFKPQDSSSVALWLKLVKDEVENAWRQNKTPAIVGGSGMYISKLIEGINEIPEITPEIKSQIKAEFEEIGIEDFRKKLISLGEEKEKIEKLDKQRLIRIYEVLVQTGKSLSWWQNKELKRFFDAKIFTHINLNPNRELLYKNCNLRFESMFKNGAVEEVKKLMIEVGFNKTPSCDEVTSGHRNLSPRCMTGSYELYSNFQITKTLGFCEISDFLEGKISAPKAIEIASQKTRNYAKRQLTWFRNQLPTKIVFEETKLALQHLKYL